MGNVFCENKHAALTQPLNNDGICLIDLHAREGTTRTGAFSGKEMAVIVNRHGLRNVKLYACIVVVNAVAGC